MRKRFWKKQWIAVALASSMAVSAVNVPVNQSTFVQAAENGNTAESTNVFYSSDKEVTTEKLNLLEEGENWSNKKEITYDESIQENISITENFTMTADVYLDEEGYNALANEGNYLKIQGVVKIGDSWEWNDSQDIHTLVKDDFTNTTQGYKASITIEFTGKTPAALKGVYFVVVGKGFAGTVKFANVILTGEQQNTIESGKIFYSSKEEAKSDRLDLPEEGDWSNKEQITYDESIQENISITENFTMTADVYLDEEGYNALANEGNYLKIQGVVKIGDSWEWNDSQDISYLEQKNFEKTEQNYKTSVTIKFTGKTPAALKGIYFVVVGQGFAGTVTFANVTLTGEPEQQITEKKDPLVIDDFEEVESGTNGWVKEAGYQYSNDVTTAVTELSGSKMLKVGLDYTGCEGIDWSEAKIKKTFAEGLDVSVYNLLTFDVIYPEEFDGNFKVKAFAQGSGTTIIEKDVASGSSDFSNGMKKAVVTIPFSPNKTNIEDITLGIIGVKTSFKGDIYIDNITLSQRDESEDFVDITSEPGEGSKADTSKMPAEVTLSDKDASAQAKALYSYLSSLGQAGQVLFGHQNDTHKCVASREGVYSDTKDVTGSISGITGLDSLALTGVESGIADTYKAIEECIKIGKAAASEGSILTLSLHMPNMSNAKITATPDASRKYDFSQCNFQEAQDLSNNCAQEVMPGGKYNGQFTTYLDIIADYAKGLGDIPVLFRPFHENNGGWFWWGSSATSGETYKAMFRYMADYLREKDVHNLIYVYSPNGPIESEEEYNERYPGDDYVDILAFDYYDDIDESSTYGDSFFNSLRSTCNVVKGLADKKGKIAAIAETGVRVTRDGSSEGIMVKDNPIKGKNWYSNVNKIAQETGMPYFLLWANFSDTNFYIPYKYNDTKGQELINEFIDFYNEESSIFANGTNFYDNADKKQVANKDQNIKSGYFINMFPMAEITDAVTLKASVKNSSVVKFVLNSESVEKELYASLNSGTGYYEAGLSKEILDSLGKTDTGTIKIVADGENIVTLPNISFGKEKPVLENHQIDDFETYAGDNGLLSSKWNTNRASGCTVNVSLTEEPRYEGSYALKFDYTETKGGWAGATIAKEADWSSYNALKFWVQPDGKNQKTVVQITAGGTDYEAYLQEYSGYADSSTPLLVTIPFSEFKAGGTSLSSEALKNVGRFGLWVNAIDDSDAFAGGGTTVSGTLYYDDIKAISADTNVPVFEPAGTKPSEPEKPSEPSTVPTEKPSTAPTEKPAGTPVPTQQPSYPYIPSQPQDGGSQTPGTIQAPAASQAPGTTQTPAASQTPAGTQAPAASQAPVATQAPAETQSPGTTTEIKKDDVTGTVTEITTTKDNNVTTVVERTTLADGTENTKETVTEDSGGIIKITETSSSSKANVVLVKNITKYTDGDVISMNAVLHTGKSEIGSDYSAKNTIPESFLNEAKEAGINNVTFCIGENIVNDVKSNRNHRMVIKVEVPKVNGVSVGKVLLADDAVKSAVEENRKLVVKILNEDPAGSYTVTIPPSELEKMQGDIDITIKAGNVPETGGDKQKNIESILSANGINAENAAIVSIASNNTKGGIKASAPVANAAIKAGGKVYVYRYNSSTGKLEEIANSARTVLKNGMTGIEGYSGNDYVATNKELSGKNVVTLLGQSKVKFNKASVKKGGKIKINTTLPEELKAETSLKKKMPYAKQAAVVTYKSSNTKAAKVSKNGTVKAAGKGKAIITVKIKLAGGKIKTIKKKITVK